MDVFISSIEETDAKVVERTDSSVVMVSNDINYAMVAKDSDYWKYVRYDEQLKQVINRIVPVQVRTALD